MDLSVHKLILRLALERTKASPKAKRFPVGKRALVDRLFYPMWLGNWASDMNQASAFFDVLETKYRDPYQRWKNDGSYDFPAVIAQNRDRWEMLYATLWDKEREATAADPTYRGIACPDGIDIADANIIGGYYPLDHFDVADREVPRCPSCQQAMELGYTASGEAAWRCGSPHPDVPVAREGACQWIPAPDSAEYTGAKNQLSWTVDRAVFEHCLYGPINRSLVGDRLSPDNLRSLGKALHILQDFFAHSNFAELMLLSAKKLPKELTQALRIAQPGSFSSFIRDVAPAEMTVVTGRFDQVDTVASILGIYRKGLVPSWDAGEPGGGGAPGRPRDLMFEVLFGTFSNEPFAREALRAVKVASGVSDFFSAVGDWVTKGAIAFFGGVAKLLADAEAQEQITKVQGLLEAATDTQARDYATAGRIQYVEQVIERYLRNRLEADRAKLGPRILPHHTLLAKDRDMVQPECRLVFKLACLLATDLTAEVLELYLTDGSREEIEAVLRRRIRHPAEMLREEPHTRAALQRLVPRIYGDRWWMVAQARTQVCLR